MKINLKFFKKNKGKKDDGVVDNSGKQGWKRFLSKLSGAFMLPISVMAIAGLFLGVGAAIESHTTAAASKQFGLFIKNMGDPVFGAMPILFACAIAIAFTEEAGVAVFATVIAFMIFNALQTVFITETKNAVWTNVDGSKKMGAEVLFAGAGRGERAMASLVTSNLGIKSLNTSVFGGIVVGSIVAYLYNRYSTISLPPILSFFGGKRFVALVAIIAMIPTSLLFLVFWPWIGAGFAWFGDVSGKAPGGLDSLLFGYVERALIPFGLHHVFYSPLWWTPAGGQLSADMFTKWVAAGHTITDSAVASELTIFFGHGHAGDQTMWIKASSLNVNDVTWTDSAGSHTQPLFKFIDTQFGYNLGRFMQGKYPFMIFALPAAGAAMIMAAPKENRKVASSAVVPAALTSLTTGVTEPIEFTFLFLAPALFWGFHAVMAAVSFMLMNVLGAHVGMTFSGGIIDLGIYGVAPISKGTNFWWALVIGAGYIPIYFAVFYFVIKKWNLKTPGRGGAVSLLTKKDYKNRGSSKSGGLTEQSKNLVAALGGYENITKFANCATRLRYDVVDRDAVDQDALKAAGAVGVMFVSKNHVQVIMGPVAEQVNNNIRLNKPETKKADVLVAAK